MNQLTITKVQPTKELAAKLGEQFSSFVIEGNASKLEAMAQTKFYQQALEIAEANLKESVLEELNKYSEKSIEIQGTKFEKAEVGTKWLFNDELLTQLEQQVKDRKELLKALKKPITEVNEDSGEVKTIYPATKTSTSSFKITLAK